MLAGGGAAYAADFVSRTLGPFPWLILGVLGLTYLVLVRAFRSLLLPLKAIVAQPAHRLGRQRPDDRALPVGLGQLGRPAPRSSQIEGWIPVFMFTLLFGLSMDYEVFLVTRMRESWDATRSNQGAVVHGLANTGRDRHGGRADHGRDLQRADVRLDPDRCSSSASASQPRS